MNPSPSLQRPPGTGERHSASNTHPPAARQPRTGAQGFRSAAVLLVAAWALSRLAGGTAAAAGIHVASPDGSLVARIEPAANGRWQWSLQRGRQVLIEPSPLGLIVDGVDLGLGSRAGPAVMSSRRETYPWRGVKRIATNHCEGVRLPLVHTASGTLWEIEARVFNDGFAYRYHVPGPGERRVEGEASSWTVPPEARLWYQTNTGDYEGAYQSARAVDIPVRVAIEGGRSRPVRIGPPVTVELPGGGFLLLTEAALFRYSGMTLRPTGSTRLEAVFEDDPQGFTLRGPIASPWRVTVATPDLGGLVNSDVVPNLNEPPDPRHFPDGARTDWIQPGRALITWCVFGNDGAQWHLQKWFVEQCAALHCEYLLVDAGWRTERWGWLKDGGDAWARLKELCEYAARRNVGIVVWHAFPEGRDDGPGLTRPEARRELFRRCQEAGVKGVKIDFFNSERLEIVEAYEDLSRLAAEHRLTINFHGAHKPTGEVRTWPNEITREGIREQEYVLWDRLPLEHYAALPFTRMAVGHSDFLPTYVRAKYLRNTTAVFQMATAILSTSSFVCWPDHPDDYRASPFLGLIQQLPLDWEETRVLPGSRIGSLAAFARRSGDHWYLGVLNGTERPVEWQTDLGFLADGDFIGTDYRDADPRPTGVHSEVGWQVKRGDLRRVELAPGGGWVAWLRPRVQP